MKIVFKGREIEVTEVCDGVVKKSDTVFYVRDSATKEWLYCSDKRLAKLTAKFGTVEKLGSEYVGRQGKHQAAPAAEAV